MLSIAILYPFGSRSCVVADAITAPPTPRFKHWPVSPERASDVTLFVEESFGRSRFNQSA
jgi:hypothetical protein